MWLKIPLENEWFQILDYISHDKYLLIMWKLYFTQFETTVVKLLMIIIIFISLFIRWRTNIPVFFK